MTMSVRGMSSGLDINGIIDQLVALERRPIKNLQHRTSRLMKEKSTWQEINTKLKSLEDALSSLKTGETLGTMKATTNSEALAASANDTAVTSEYTIDVKKLAKSHQLTSASIPTGFSIDDDFATIDAGGHNYQGTFSLITKEDDGTGNLIDKTFDITIEGTDTMKSLMKKINDTGGAFTANIVNNSLIIKSDHAGTERQFVGFNDGTSTSLGLAEKVAAQDAEIIIDGDTANPITSASNKIEDVIYGVTLDLLKVEDGINVSVSKDEEAIIGKVEEFVDAYNAVLEKVEAETSKGATLQGDGTALRLESKLHTIVTKQLLDDTHSKKYLMDIGIGVTDRTGKLQIDKDKLAEAINNDPQAVKDLFYKKTDAGDEFGITHELGLYSESFTKYGDGILTTKEQSIQNSIEDINSQIERYEHRVASYEQRLIRQFTQMEQAISSMKNQQSWMSGQTASLSSMMM